MPRLFWLQSRQLVSFCSWVIPAIGAAILTKHYFLAMDFTEHMNRYGVIFGFNRKYPSPKPNVYLDFTFIYLNIFDDWHFFYRSSHYQIHPDVYFLSWTKCCSARLFFADRSTFRTTIGADPLSVSVLFVSTAGHCRLAQPYPH